MDSATTVKCFKIIDRFDWDTLWTETDGRTDGQTAGRRGMKGERGKRREAIGDGARGH